MNWDFYSKRRRVTLQAFLFGIDSLKEAKIKFHKLGIVPPAENLIEYHIAKQLDSQEDLSVDIVADPVSTELEDIEYLKKNLFDSLKIPEKYLAENKIEQEQVPNQKKKKK